MRLQAGMAAPMFRVDDVFGNPIDLTHYANGMMLLSFFRNAACAMCNLRVHHLMQRYPAWQAQGLTVLTVFESPRESILDYVGRQDAPFPIIADPQEGLYTLYGVETSADKVAATMARSELKAMVGEAAAQGFNLTHEPGSNFERMPADFLIGPDLIIREAHYADYVWDHLPFEVIEQYLGQPELAF